MKLGLVLVVTHYTWHTYVDYLKSLNIDLQVIFWYARKDFGSFLSTRFHNGKMIISDITDHSVISERIREMEWFQNCDAILIINYDNNVFMEIDKENNSIFIKSEYQGAYTIFENNIPIYSNSDNEFSP